MSTGIDPKVDYVFKKLFGSEANLPVLADILQAVVNPPPDGRFVELEIRNPFNEKDTFSDKLSVVDVKVRDQRGENYNLEMQMCATPTYPDRVLYYWARIYAEQLKEGDDYDKLKSTISISFLNDVLFPEVADHHLTFELRSAAQPGLVFSTRQVIHVIELPKFVKTAEELATPLDAWRYFLKHAAGLDAGQLPLLMKTPALMQAMEVLDVISKDDLERERYEAKVRYERDQRSLAKWAIEKARNEGLAEGRNEGLNEGRNEGRNEGLNEGFKKGILVGRILANQRFLSIPMMREEELFALSVEQLESTVKTLDEQVSRKA